jgi:hypothetical protein
MDPEDPWDEEDGEELEAEIMRADHAFGAELPETTRHEALSGSGLDEALAREAPDRGAIDEAVAVVDDGDPDTEDELVAEGSVVMDDYTSPEEAALSVRDDAPGATDHPVRTRTTEVEMAEEFVSVLATSSALEAEIVQGRLESEGIPVLLKGEGIDAPYPTGPVYVFVPASFEARARQLLDDGN